MGKMVKSHLIVGSRVLFQDENGDYNRSHFALGKSITQRTEVKEVFFSMKNFYVWEEMLAHTLVGVFDEGQCFSHVKSPAAPLACSHFLCKH